MVLGGCLAERGDPAGALPAYEERRRRRVERIVAYGRRNGSTKAAGPVGAAVRDALLPLAMRLAHRRGNPQAWILDHRL